MYYYPIGVFSDKSNGPSAKTVQGRFKIRTGGVSFSPCQVDLVLSGYLVPAGTKVFCISQVAAVDEDNFKVRWDVFQGFSTFPGSREVGGGRSDLLCCAMAFIFFFLPALRTRSSSGPSATWLATSTTRTRTGCSEEVKKHPDGTFKTCGRNKFSFKHVAEHVARIPRKCHYCFS